MGLLAGTNSRPPSGGAWRGRNPGVFQQSLLVVGEGVVAVFRDVDGCRYEDRCVLAVVWRRRRRKMRSGRLGGGGCGENGGNGSCAGGGDGFSSATPAGLEVDLGLLGFMEDDVACVKAFVAAGERVRPDA